MGMWRRLILTKLLLQNFSKPVSLHDLREDMRKRTDCTPKELEYLLDYAVDNSWLTKTSGNVYRTTEKGERLVEALENEELEGLV